MKTTLLRPRVRPWVGVASVLVLVASAVAPAEDRRYPASPEDVVQEYRRLDSTGVRLTPDGWYRTAVFFTKPAHPPAQFPVAVIDDERFHCRVPTKERDEGRVTIEFFHTSLGQIDTVGRFTSVVVPDLIDRHGVLLKAPVHADLYAPVPMFRDYELSLADEHWEITPNRLGDRVVKGARQWRFTYFDYEPTVTIEVAIRYLERLQRESNSEAIRGNAAKSILALRRMKSARR